jgi:aspartate/methionine/tyrosine aminotransferase
MNLDRFEMERYQSVHWPHVDYDLSESGVLPMTIRELLGPAADAEAFLAGTWLGYPLSEGSLETRTNIATWYPGATPDHVSVVNGGSEANFLTLWTLLGDGDRLAFMVPNYLQGRELGRRFGKGTHTFGLRLGESGWSLDVDELNEVVGKRTRAIMVCNPNNPTGSVLTEVEMDAVVVAADRVGAWIVADEIYRGAELDSEEATPTFFGRYDKVVVTSGLSKAFAMPGLRLGWVVASRPELIQRIRERHDYTTLTPTIVSDRLAALAMLPEVRASILTRTRTIIRANYPSLEHWLGTHADLFRWARPAAGAIQYATYDLPIKSMKLAERIRQERSVLLVPGDMFGARKGLRFGFGYDIERTVKALALVDDVLAEVRAEATAGVEAIPI